jgi:hypothetical protein
LPKIIRAKRQRGRNNPRVTSQGRSGPQPGWIPRQNGDQRGVSVEAWLTRLRASVVDSSRAAVKIRQSLRKRIGLAAVSIRLPRLRRRRYASLLHSDALPSAAAAETLLHDTPGSSPRGPPRSTRSLGVRSLCGVHDRDSQASIRSARAHRWRTHVSPLTATARTRCAELVGRASARQGSGYYDTDQIVGIAPNHRKGTESALATVSSSTLGQDWLRIDSS